MPHPCTAQVLLVAPHCQTTTPNDEYRFAHCAGQLSGLNTNPGLKDSRAVRGRTTDSTRQCLVCEDQFSPKLDQRAGTATGTRQPRGLHAKHRFACRGLAACNCRGIGRWVFGCCYFGARQKKRGMVLSPVFPNAPLPPPRSQRRKRDIPRPPTRFPCFSRSHSFLKLLVAIQLLLVLVFAQQGKSTEGSTDIFA